jgi:hypothetical protein
VFSIPLGVYQLQLVMVVISSVVIVTAVEPVGMVRVVVVMVTTPFGVCPLELGVLV